MAYCNNHDLKEHFSIRQEYAFDVWFTDEYGKLVYDLEELRPGSAKEVLKAALAELKLQNAIQEILDFDQIDK